MLIERFSHDRFLHISIHVECGGLIVLECERQVQGTQFSPIIYITKLCLMFRRIPDCLMIR